MDPFTLGLIGLALLIGVLFLLGGAIQTFRRQPVVAILCIIFLLPVWIIWAIVEVFLPRPE